MPGPSQPRVELLPFACIPPFLSSLHLIHSTNIVGAATRYEAVSLVGLGDLKMNGMYPVSPFPEDPPLRSPGAGCRTQSHPSG